MTPKEQAAMQQALMYLDAIINGDDVKPYELEGTALTLREALANTRSSIRSTSEYSEQAEQEPVAWAHPSGGYLSARYMKEFATGLEKETHIIPLYAAPLASQDTHATHVVRTKDPCNPLQDLTDDEIHKCMNGNFYNALDFARAVIAADREKNNV